MAGLKMKWMKRQKQQKMKIDEEELEANKDNNEPSRKLLKRAVRSKTFSRDQFKSGIVVECIYSNVVPRRRKVGIARVNEKTFLGGTSASSRSRGCGHGDRR